MAHLSSPSQYPCPALRIWATGSGSVSATIPVDFRQRCLACRFVGDNDEAVLAHFAGGGLCWFDATTCSPIATFPTGDQEPGVAVSSVWGPPDASPLLVAAVRGSELCFFHAATGATTGPVVPLGEMENSHGTVQSFLGVAVDQAGQKAVVFGAKRVSEDRFVRSAAAAATTEHDGHCSGPDAPLLRCRGRTPLFMTSGLAR